MSEALQGFEPTTTTSATAVGKPAYTAQALVELILQQPTWRHEQYAGHFGRGLGWFYSILASDSFQLVLDPYRHQIADPTITSTLQERFRALTLRSLGVLQAKMDLPDVSDIVVIKAAEIGIKALGMGQQAQEAPAPTPTIAVESLAEKLVSALEKQRRNVRTITVPATVEVPAESQAL